MICSNYQFCLPFKAKIQTKLVKIGISLIILGIIIFPSGILFHLQGQGIVGPESSFMYFNPEWITYGLQIVLIGLAILGFGVILVITKKG